MAFFENSRGTLPVLAFLVAGFEAFFEAGFAAFGAAVFRAPVALGAAFFWLTFLVEVACFGAVVAPGSATVAVCVVVLLASAFMVALSFSARDPRPSIH